MPRNVSYVEIAWKNAPGKRLSPYLFTAEDNLRKLETCVVKDKGCFSLSETVEGESTSCLPLKGPIGKAAFRRNRGRQFRYFKSVP